MNLSPKLFFSQPSLLHKELGNDNGPIVYITTFNNMLKNEEDMHFFPCLHYIYMNWYPLVIDSNHFICT